LLVVSPVTDTVVTTHLAIMADDSQGAGASPKDEPTHVEVAEDAETRATRRELKQSSISDQGEKTREDSATDDNRPETPSLALPADKIDRMKEQVSSPKKKRAHDQLDEEQASQDNDTTSVTSTDSAKDRSTRLEPEKKRHRDHEPADVSSVRTSLVLLNWVQLTCVTATDPIKHRSRRSRY
jgi:DEAD/DEAH box helicase domain-containing protein